MSAVGPSAERDAEGFHPAVHCPDACSEFGCDAGQRPVAGPVLLAEPVAVDRERGLLSARRDAEGFPAAGQAGDAHAEFGCDAGEGSVPGHVLLVEPVAVDRERRAVFGGGSPPDSVVPGEAGDGGLARPVPAADLLQGHPLVRVEVVQFARGQACPELAGCLASGAFLGWGERRRGRGVLVEDGAYDVDRGAGVERGGPGGHPAVLQQFVDLGGWQCQGAGAGEVQSAEQGGRGPPGDFLCVYAVACEPGGRVVVEVGGERRGDEDGELVEPVALICRDGGVAAGGAFRGGAADALEEPPAGGERPVVLAGDCPCAAADPGPVAVRQEVSVVEAAPSLVVDRGSVLVEPSGQAGKRGNGRGPAGI